MSGPSPDRLVLSAESNYPSDRFNDNVGFLRITTATPFKKYQTDICRLKNLTDFTIHYMESNDKLNLNVLLNILKINSKLQRVDIDIGYQPMPEDEWHPESPINLPDLKYLFLKLNRWENAEYMISRIPITIPKNKAVEVSISCPIDDTPLATALVSIKNFASSLTEMTMDFSDGDSGIKWCGKNGQLRLSRVSHADMCEALAGGYPLLSCNNIESFRLKFGGSPPLLKPSVSLFPTLKTMAVSGLDKLNTDGKTALEEFATSVRLCYFKTRNRGKAGIWQAE